MTETEVQIELSRYITREYKNCLFHNDFGSGTKLSYGQAKRQKAMNPIRGHPDMQILEPIGRWNGCFIELKKDGTKIYRRDGRMVADEHIREQADYIMELRRRGYWADFAIGLDQAKRIVDSYMKGKASEEWQNLDS